MDTQQLILDLLALLAPYIVAHAFTVGASLYHRIAQRLPANQRAALDYIAHKAVTMVEQKYKSLGSAEKRMYAETAFYALCKHFDVAVPDRTVVDAFIETAVNALDKEVSVQSTVVSEDTAKAVALPNTKS